MDENSDSRTGKPALPWRLLPIIALVGLLVSVCGEPNAPVESGTSFSKLKLRERNTQAIPSGPPTSEWEFAKGEAIAIVKSWLSQRTVLARGGFDCLTYHSGFEFSEKWREQPPGTWLVSHRNKDGSLHKWRVYEKSLAVDRTTRSQLC